MGHRVAFASIVRCALLVAGAGLALVVSPPTRAATVDDAPPPVPEGIWKAAVPVHPMHGEFGGLDPLGLAAGARIPADCSLNWTDPDSGKLYCFASGTSLVVFLENPWANLRSAEAAWTHLGMHDQGRSE